jgi:hypothetical protein
MVIDGTEANDNGFQLDGVNQQGWLYMQRVFEKLAQELGATVAAKVVVDMGTKQNTLARLALQAAFDQSQLPSQGWTITHVNGTGTIETWLKNISPSNTGILYLPTVGLVGGDLDNAELTAVISEAAKIKSYISNGGALFAMGETGLLSFGWLISILPTINVATYGGVNTPLTLTPAGQSAFPGLTGADLSTGPWRNSFSGNLGGLKVLATAPGPSGQTENVIIGGGSGSGFTPAPPSSLPVTVPPTHGFAITRDHKFWFTHPKSADPLCATIKRTIELNGGGLSLGFFALPVTFRDGDAVKDEEDAMMEALGFHWLKKNRTGEEAGTQDFRLRGSNQCLNRKRLAVQLIAAQCNNILLGTGPQNATYLGKTNINGQVVSAQIPFPADLIEQAGVAAAGDDVKEMQRLRKMLRDFNRSGVTNNFIGNVVECSEETRSARTLARDPTTQASCPGFNDFCYSATGVGSFPFRQTVDLSKYTDTLPSSQCAIDGREAVWRISPPVAAPGRQFTVDTFGSNFDTVISIWRGDCREAIAILEVGCNDNADSLTKQSLVSFGTDGTDSYFIVIGGYNGAYGELKVRITSP